MDTDTPTTDSNAASDVLRVAAGVGSVLVLLSAATLAFSGAGNATDSVLVALGIPALAWAAWRPSWVSGLVATGAAALPLTYLPLGIVIVPVIGGATLVMMWQRTRDAGVRRPVSAALSLVLVVAALVPVAWYLGLLAIVFPPTGGTIALDEYFANDMRDGVDATAELCGGLEGCMEGYTTPDADYRRFEDTEQAAEFAAGAEDTVADRHIAVSFGPDAGPHDRANQLEQLRTTHRSD